MCKDVLKGYINAFLEMIGKRLVYVIVNTPVGRPQYVQTILKANPYLAKMFEENRDQHLSKRDCERLGIMPMPGPRYKMLPYSIWEDFFTKNMEPSGPDFTDRMTAKYIKEQEEK